MEMTAIPARVAPAYPAMEPTLGPLSSAGAEGSAEDEFEGTLVALEVRVTVNC